MAVYMISLKPEYANAILQRKKKYEIRTRVPNLLEDDIIYMYATAPISKVVGFFKVDGLILGSPNWLYKMYYKKLKISPKDYFNYLGERNLVNLIRIKYVRKFAFPLELKEYHIKRPPQWFIKVGCER